MRRFDRLPPEVKERLPEVYRKYKKYLGTYAQAKANGFRSVTAPSSSTSRSRRVA